MLERMDEFFDSRLDGYDEHQLGTIDNAREFYPYTAGLLPKESGARVLDLGCGTGLELTEYYALNPGADVTGIDLTQSMLDALKEKLPGRKLTLICGSYFDVPFGTEVYDAAVSVESLHHFTAAEKLPLYKKLRQAIKPGGYFLLTDYFALSDEEETRLREELARIKREENITDGGLYHFDIPSTLPHETQVLLEAGFTSVKVLKQWGATITLRADR